MSFAFHSKNFGIVTLFSFITVAIFCLWPATVMNTENAMNDCVLYGSEPVLCGTNVQNHISAWQDFLNVIPEKTFSLLLLILLLIIASATYKTVWPRAPEVAKRFKPREFSILGIIDPIKQALARGIIQPKIYEDA